MLVSAEGGWRDCPAARCCVFRAPVSCVLVVVRSPLPSAGRGFDADDSRLAILVATAEKTGAETAQTYQGVDESYGCEEEGEDEEDVEDGGNGGGGC